MTNLKLNKEKKIKELKNDFLEMEQNYEFLESQINETILNNLKPNKMAKLKKVLKKVNKVLTNLAAGANYAIRQ